MLDKYTQFYLLVIMISTVFFCEGCSNNQKNPAFSLVGGEHLKLSLGESAENAIGLKLEIGQMLQVLRDKGNYIRVEVIPNRTKGWIHQALTTDSPALIEQMRKIDFKPKAILFLSNYRSSRSFTIKVLSGSVAIENLDMHDPEKMQLKANYGDCIVLADEPQLSKYETLSLDILSVTTPLSQPKSGILYCYDENTNSFRPLIELLQKDKQ